MRSSSGYLFSWIGTLSISARPSLPLCVSFSLSVGSLANAERERDLAGSKAFDTSGALFTKFPRRSNFSNRLLLPVEVGATRCERIQRFWEEEDRSPTEGTNQRMALPDLNFKENPSHAPLIANYILGESDQLKFRRTFVHTCRLDFVSGDSNGFEANGRERERERWVHLVRERLVLYSHDCGRLSKLRSPLL